MDKLYQRIDWENYPSDATPLNESNLNKMDSAVNGIDDRVVALDTSMATKAEVATLVADVTFEESTGIITITKKNGSVITIDTKMEKIAVNFDYDPATQQIILTLIDGTKQYIDLSALITQYEFLNSDTITFAVQADGTVKAEVLDGSISEDKLEPNYLAKIKVEAAKAQASQNAAATSEANAAASANAAATSATEAEASAEQAKNYYENLAQSGNVTGVKGSEEVSFRTGNVIITAENVGALPKGGNAASAEKATKDGNGNVIADTYATKDIYKNTTGGISTGETNFADTYRPSTKLINAVSFTFQTATEPAGSYGYVGYDSSTGKYIVTMNCTTSITALNSYVGKIIGESDLEISFSYSDINDFTEYDLDSVKIVNNKTLILYFTDGVEYESLDHILDGYGSSSVTLWIYTGAEITPLYQNRIGGRTNSFQYTSWKESPALSVYSLMSEGASTNWTKRMRLSNGGNMYLNSGGSYNSTGADYGEFWEWLDTNSNNEDRIGLFVTLDGNKIKFANSSSDYVLGAISANACIVGNAEEEWKGKWLKDDFGRTLYETVEITDENGNVVLAEQPILNPEYDDTKIYIPRSERQEWDIVGMFGVLTVIDNGTCEVNSYATVGENGTAVPADENSIKKYRVIKRISDNVIQIVFK